MSFRKYFYSVLGLSMVFFIVIGIFNYKIDPGNIFGNETYIKGVGDILLSGKNVANVQNYDERLLQKYVIENTNDNKDVIVLGSSRTMAISEDYFPYYTFYNYSVSSASLEDDIALFWLNDKKGFKPKKIIIALDAWLLNKNNQQIGWKSLDNEYNMALNLLDFKNNIKNNTVFFEKYKQLISIAYLEASIKRRFFDEKTTYYETGEKYLDNTVILADGSRVFEKKIRNISFEEADKAALKYMYGSNYPLEKYYELDAENQEIFEKFIVYLQKNDIEVVFYLTPYHPIVYKALVENEKYKIIDNVEDYFRKFAETNSIKVIGSYNPYECNLDEKDFSDGMHMRKESVDKFLKGKI
jgi:hypothetical protein